MEATLAAPPAPAATPPSPGPKPFDNSGGTSKFGSMRDALKANAGAEPERRPEPKEPTPDPVEKVVPPEKVEKTEPVKPEEKVAETAKPADKSAKSKVNPWNELKSVRSEKAALEAELSRVKSSVVPEQERTALTQRMETIQRENEELRNKIRFKDYESSPDFAEKFHKPYEQQLGVAMEYLGRIPITDAISGQQRPANEQDLFELMNMNPVEAAEKAESLFGRLGPTVQQLANDVRKTLLARNRALDDEKKNGATREQQAREHTERQQKQLATATMALFEAANKETLAKDPEMAQFIQPISIPEGKQATPEETEHNDAVKRGYEMVDKWWAKQAKDCKNEEEYKDLVRHKAAIRDRAGGFGPLRRKFNRMAKELATVKKDLAAYQTTTPDAGGRTAGGSGRSIKPAQNAGSFKHSLRSGLAKYAGRGT